MLQRAAQQHPPHRFRDASGRVNIVLTFLVAAIAGLVGFVWYLNQRIENQQVELSSAERWSEFIERKLHESQEAMASLQSRAEEAQGRAAQAEDLAMTTERARRDAELEREFMREEAERLRQETAQAHELAAASQREAERLRRQRQRELNRMQEALGHIAETVRTPMGMVVNLGEDSFLFDFDKTGLRPENREILSRIAGVLLASHGFRLYVYGHTDDVGPADYNQQLSEGRAQAVRDYLATAGIPPEIIEVKGFGETSPKAPGETPLARQKNRRVEIGVIDTIINYTAAPESANP
jgi:outer membrane protein OmpA-like peptidoglycan-associated protein